MKIVLLIYNDYDTDNVTTKSETLKADDDDIRVYHFPVEDAVEFFEQRKKGSVDEVFYTQTIPEADKEIFSKEPYNGKEMS